MIVQFIPATLAKKAIDGYRSLLPLKGLELINNPDAAKLRPTSANMAYRMTPTLFLIVTIVPLLVGTAHAQGCSDCGCRGGPGYRGPDGKCVGWAALNRICGTPPTTRCTAELVNSGKSIKAKEGAVPK